MHCPNCGKSNPAGSVYCNFCGNKMPTVDIGSVKCPYCGEPGQEYRFNCSKCGKELPRDSTGKPLPMQADSGKKFCRGCGKELGSGVTICPYCGTSTADLWSKTSSSGTSYFEDESHDDELFRRSETSTPIIAGIMLVLAGILALGQGAVYLLANSIASSIPGSNIGGSLCFCGGLDVVFGLAAIGGAIACFGRSSFMFAIIGAILGMLGLGFLIGGLFGLIGIILVAVARAEFES